MIPWRSLERWVEPLRRTVRGMIAKAVLEAVSDGSDLQVVRLKVGGETHDGVERIQEFGFTSHPPAGSQAVVVFVGGRRDNPLVVACDDGRVRKKVAAGEAAVYNSSGAFVHLQAGGRVVIGNPQAELLDLLDQVLAGLQAATVAAPGGPYPLVNAANFTAIKTLLAQLKGSP